MLIKFFRNGQGGGVGPVDYLVEREVVAYDDNRNVLRDGDGNVLMFERDPLPDVLRGDPEQMRHLIDACEHQWSYRAGVVSFSGEDAPTPEQQRMVMDGFEALAFAGLEPDQRDILWVRHSHEDRVELHFVTPRMELATGRSLNIAPPGYQKAYDALRDVLNKEHGWSDPQAPERAREVKSLIESVKRGEGREQIHDWIMDRIEAEEITNRADMIKGLSQAGFDIPRAGKEYLTARDPVSGERWRLKGDIFREDWTRENTANRALEREGQPPSRSGSRLDGIALKTLRERLHDITKRRADYNRERYPVTAASTRTNESENSFERPDGSPDEPGRHSDQLRSELVLGRSSDRKSAEREPLEPRTDDKPHQQWIGAELGREPRQADRVSYWNRIRKMFANLGKGIVNDRTGTFANSTRTRIDGIRRKIDRSLRAIGNSVQGIGREIEEEVGNASNFNRKLTDMRDRISGLANGRPDRAGKQLGPELTEGIERKPDGHRAGTGDVADRNLTDHVQKIRRRTEPDYEI